MSYQLQQRLEKREPTRQRIAYELRMADPCKYCGVAPVFEFRDDLVWFVCRNFQCRAYSIAEYGRTFVRARRAWNKYRV